MTTHRALPGLVIAVLVTVALASVVLTAVGLHRDPVPGTARAADPAPGAHVRPEVEAAAVLKAWDSDRAAAWAAGDVRRLRSLYAPGSVAAERDVAMLQRWSGRGLVVSGLRMQVLSLDVISRAPDRWVLHVVDRLAWGTDGSSALPQDAPTSRTLVLRRLGGRWLVSAVR